MSDETIQYITTDYLIEVDGGEPTPAPVEYIVELGQVGVQGIPGEKGEPGFSPTVGYILNDNTFKINITNQDGVTQTPNLYDYFADKNGYLKVDGNNASNPITINGHTFESLYGGLNTKLTMTGGPAYIEAPILVLRSTNTGKVYYKSSNANNEIATIGDIPTVSDATITLTQGGVTKGTFTLNGSATTIDLDASGGTITNPLEIESSNGNKVLSLGIDEDDANKPFFMNCNLVSSMGTFNIPVHLITSSTSPITLTKSSGGTTTVALDYDTNTLKVENNKLTVIGGGGSYTAGTGIDITSGVISIDSSVVATQTDISDMATQTWVGNQGYVTTSDLSTTLADYVLSSSLATVATTGSYSDLSNKPTIPTNSDYVDLTTDQTIGGTKTFSNATNYGANIVFDGSSNSQALTSIINNVQRNLISRNHSASYVYVGNINDHLNLRGSATRPSYYNLGITKDIAFTDDIPNISNLADKDLSNLSTTGQDIIDGKADTDLSNITTVNTQITTTAINPLINKLTDADITTAPSSQIDTGLIFRDNNDINIGGLKNTRYTNGTQATSISAINNISGTSKIAYLNVYVDGSGNDHSDASAGVKNSIAQISGGLNSGISITFDASGNYTPTQNGYLTVQCTSAGAGSIAYLWNGNIGTSVHHDTSGYVVVGTIPVKANVTANISFFGGMTLTSAMFSARGGY